MQIEPNLLIVAFREDSERQASRHCNLLAVEVGRQMAGIRYHELTIGAEPGGLTSCEAVAADQYAIQGVENLRRTSFRSASQRTHQHGDVHGGLEPLAGHVADYDQQAAITCRLHVEKVAAHFIRGAIN